MSYDLDQLTKDLQNKKQYLVMANTNWGKDGWNFLYNIALAGNGNTENIHDLLKNLGALLPCKECIEHYNLFLQNNKLPDNHVHLFNWLQKLENEIAKKKYGKDYKYINRYRNIQKISLVKYTDVNDKTNCKRCYHAKKKHRSVYKQKVIKF